MGFESPTQRLFHAPEDVPVWLDLRIYYLIRIQALGSYMVACRFLAGRKTIPKIMVLLCCRTLTMFVCNLETHGIVFFNTFKHPIPQMLLEPALSNLTGSFINELSDLWRVFILFLYENHVWLLKIILGHYEEHKPGQGDRTVGAGSISDRVPRDLFKKKVRSEWELGCREGNMYTTI